MASTFRVDAAEPVAGPERHAPQAVAPRTVAPRTVATTPDAVPTVSAAMAALNKTVDDVVAVAEAAAPPTRALDMVGFFVPEGPGWWKASNGLWYPPIARPGAPAADGRPAPPVGETLPRPPLLLRPASRRRLGWRRRPPVA